LAGAFFLAGALFLAGPCALICACDQGRSMVDTQPAVSNA